MCGHSGLPDGDNARRPLIVVLDPDEALREALRFSLETEGYRVSALSDVGALLACPDCRAGACFVIDEACQDPKLTALSAAQRTPMVILSSHLDRLVRTKRHPRISLVEKPLMTDALSRQIAAALAAVEG
jgi:FixJ family two-component response regulator